MTTFSAKPAEVQHEYGLSLGQITPDAGEISACRWWIEQERGILRPRMTVALGATAARSLTGKTVTISAGDIAIAPTGAVHGFVNTGSEDFVFVSVVCPELAGFEEL